MVYRNPSISIKSLLSIISTSKWEPLDTEVTSKVTGTHKRGATASFRRMLGIDDLCYGPNYHTIIGQVLISNIEGVRVARCYEVFVQRAKPVRGGHRFFWRVFPMSTSDAEIAASARAEISGRAFLPKSTEGVDKGQDRAPAGLFGSAPIFPEPQPSTVAVLSEAAKADPSNKVTDICGMSNDALISLINAHRAALTALEAERDTRIKAANDLIALLAK